MPGDYRCIDECDVFVTVYWGRLSLVDILDTISRRIHDPDLPSVKANVIDLSHPTWTEVPPQLIHDQLERLRHILPDCVRYAGMIVGQENACEAMARPLCGQGGGLCAGAKGGSSWQNYECAPCQE